MIHSNENDTEYLGGYITKITHYDEWDEWIEKTCTRQVPDGRDENGHTKYRTETYDCSYRDFHPERWKYTNNYGHEEYFWSEKEFLDAMRELGNPPMVFRDMHRDYYHIDGDAQDYFYDGKVEHIRALTDAHSYKNKLINSKSIFKYEEISPEEARKLGLFDYPEIKSYDQEVVLGIDVSYTTGKKFKYINAVYGSPKQFRVYILAFKNKNRRHIGKVEIKTSLLYAWAMMPRPEKSTGVMLSPGPTNLRLKWQQKGSFESMLIWHI